MGLKKYLFNVYKKQILEKAKKDSSYDSYYALKAVVLNITMRCNFDCKHCFRNRTDTKDLPFEIIEKVIREGKKYKFRHISLSGGEPFLYPKFKELIELIAKNDYVFNIVTNGLVFREFVDLIRQYKNRLTIVKFSLESRDKKLHDSLRREGSFDKLIDDFQICRKYKIPFSTLTTVNPLNYNEVIDIGIFAKRQGAKFVIFSTMFPCPNTQKNELVLDTVKRKELFLIVKDLYKVIKLPVVITAAIRAHSNIAPCYPLRMDDISVDVDGNLVQCCDLADYDSERVSKGAIVTSLKDKTFAEGLKKLVEHIYKASCARIEDFEKQSDPEDIDFNSCFYCVHRLEKGH